MDAKQRDSLPVPDAEALARSTTLTARIAAEIAESGGWMPFSRYMELALYTPGLGYYSSVNTKFGPLPTDGSDFITAPEISPLFGRSLAQPVAEALAIADVDEIMEFGAGTGKLAAELLTALDTLDADQPLDPITQTKRLSPASPVRRCRQYTIVELSGELRERQRQTLLDRGPGLIERVRWIDRLPDQFSGVIVGNEVLDAMPVQLYPCIAGQWFERGVGLRDSTPQSTDADADAEHGTHGNMLCLVDRPIDASAAPHAMPEIAADAHAAMAAIAASGVDYVVETHAAARAFVTTVCTMLTRGAAIFIDYGFPAHEYYHPQRAQGTLMCHYRHQAHTDALRYPGLQDITAHVEFSALASAASETGADILGYMSQARFLINSGIADQLSRFATPSDARRYLPAASGVQKLLSEAEMGELFKVIGFSRAMDDVPSAFIAGDRSWTLLPDEAPHSHEEHDAS